MPDTSASLADVCGTPPPTYPEGRRCPGVRRKPYLRPRCGALLSRYSPGPLCGACREAALDAPRRRRPASPPTVTAWLAAQRPPRASPPPPAPPDADEIRALRRCAAVEVAELGDLPPEPVRRLARAGHIMRWGTRKGAWEITTRGRRALDARDGREATP